MNLFCLYESTTTANRVGKINQAPAPKHPVTHHTHPWETSPQSHNNVRAGLKRPPVSPTTPASALCSPCSTFTVTSRGLYQRQQPAASTQQPATLPLFDLRFFSLWEPKLLSGSTIARSFTARIASWIVSDFTGACSAARNRHSGVGKRFGSAARVACCASLCSVRRAGLGGHRGRRRLKAAACVSGPPLAAVDSSSTPPRP